MPPHPHLPAVIAAAGALSAGLRNPALLVGLHRDIDGLTGKDGRSLKGSKKQYALRWGIFTTSYAAVEAFFNDVLALDPSRTRHLPLNPDKLRHVAQQQGVRLFTNDWGVRTRTLGTAAGNRSRWTAYVGTREVNLYLADMKTLRDVLSHGGNPYAVSNHSGALWPLKGGGHSMRLMGAEGFIQACCDLGSQTLLAFGGTSADFPEWPEPERSGLSAERRPSLPLLH
ncbi:hypothetical protein [Streptomyces sp. NPDC048606]|uniref:hypothetical protein n=1 Tax=Streptomyces sp. NPDC048606 TaxID=3154726 RepID=UPI00342F83ED